MLNHLVRRPKIQFLVLTIFFSAVAPNITGFILAPNLCVKDELLLVCIIEGIPRPTMTWSSRTLMNSQDSLLVSNVTNGLLQIWSMSPLSDVSGIYSCQANNALGLEEQNFFVGPGEGATIVYLTLEMGGLAIT